MGRPAKTTDSDVLDITYALAWQRGCDDLTIRDLEVALDLRAPSIYRRFHSRDELLAAAIDRYSERVVGGRVRRYLDAADDPLHGIRQFFLSAVDSTTNPNVPRGCLLATTSQQASYGIPVIRDAVSRGVATVENALLAALDRSVDRGHRFASPSRDLAGALLQGFLGVLMLMRCGHEHLEPSVNVMLDALLGPDLQPA
ncbi:MAG: TetR/AcrR family transcriptional regulator [Mycobacterium sp.]